MCQELTPFGMGITVIEMYAGSLLAVLKLVMSPGREYLIPFNVSICL